MTVLRRASVGAVAACGGLAACAGLAGSALAAGGAPLPAGSARVQGTFQMSGRITAARHVQGEQRGDRITRTWSFTPLCPSGPCSSVRVTRLRPGGSDTTVLTATTPTTYTGQGILYAPLRCAGRVRRRGEAVPFTLRITITSVALVLGVRVASAIHATYDNRSRRNLTRCVDIPGHDAAVYDGQIAGGG